MAGSFKSSGLEARIAAAPSKDMHPPLGAAMLLRANAPVGERAPLRSLISGNQRRRFVYQNLLFLLLPYRVGPDGRAGAQFLGKALLLMVLKVVTLGVLAAAGFAAWWGMAMLTGSPAAAVGAAALAMLVPCIPLTWLVGRTFARFDLTADAPAP